MADKGEKREEDELEPVGPGSEMEPEDQTPRDVEGEDIRDDREEDAPEDRDDERDDRVARSESDDDSDEDQGGDRERIRARRRAERKAKKEENRRNQRELSFLRTRNEQLERRQSEFDARIANSEVTAIDTKIAQIESDIRKADDVYAEAITKGDGSAAAEAQKIRDQLKDGVGQLQRHKQGVIQGTRERLQGNQNKPDPEISRRAQNWQSDNPWYDPKGGDEDSVIAAAIDRKLFSERGAEGAKTDDYWEEYNRRLKRRLPHLFEKDKDDRDDRDDYDETDDRDIDEHNRRTSRDRREREDDRPAKKQGGPRFTSGGRERPLKKNEVYVSEERRKAMEEAGVWDDPVLRNRYLKSYQNYDAVARRNRR